MTANAIMKWLVAMVTLISIGLIILPEMFSATSAWLVILGGILILLLIWASFITIKDIE